MSSLLPSAVPNNEEVLSLDLEENDFLYRIRRNSRIVYVSLRNIPRWKEDWKTLTVRKTIQGIESTPSEFPPHGINLGQITIPTAIFVNLLDLTTVSRISDRLSCVRRHGELCILKVARFRHEIPDLQQEVSVYTTLKLSGFPHAPKFIGFVYEETKDRIVGFLMESITGEAPCIQNLGICTEIVQLLHKFGVVLEDLNKYNFLITEQGAKVFDFENSVVQENVDTETAGAEIKALAAALEDESGIGRR
ncbi:hypothetical protein BDV25DRAFT_168188 [Aspergillus avenaceus]|uniref:Protein kinase domain-containing protein n=1 Tax=Aspergillus avenaceus TaxID=36643 RepID=A0A5N6TS22_ASPAV|nr:hypothetical protein BDV25DRAFT_168188 [Aspergillus avenaceus]